MKVIYYIIVNFIRPIWSLIINLWVMPLYGLKLMVAKPAERIKYKQRIRNWNGIHDLTDLVEWFTDEFEYKSDGVHGIFDHDNTAIEFFQKFGDCDDAALWVKRILKKNKFQAWRVWMNGNGIRNNHFDCLIHLSNGEFCLFNYGNPIYGQSFDICMTKLKSRYKGRIKGTIYFKCLW